MNRCPITYEECEGRYSRRGLNLLSPALKELRDFPYSAAQQIREATARAGKMSVQGVQPKLSAVLRPADGGFHVVDRGGRYILKPQHPAYPELPENEDLTMRLAALVGLEVPLHGLLHCVDGSFTYFIRRFDRVGRSGRHHVEDFAQLSGRVRDTKYDSSMEQIASLMDRHCTFPAVEKARLLRLSLFCFLTGNEDMHLKNFSLMHIDGLTRLSPAYDLLNTTLVLPADAEELALPLKGKRRRLNRFDWVDYWGQERLGFSSAVVDRELSSLKAALPRMISLIGRSFLSPASQEGYLDILSRRWKVLEGGGVMP